MASNYFLVFISTLELPSLYLHLAFIQLNSIFHSKSIFFLFEFDRKGNYIVWDEKMIRPKQTAEDEAKKINFDFIFLFHRKTEIFISKLKYTTWKSQFRSKCCFNIGPRKLSNNRQNDEKNRKKEMKTFQYWITQHLFYHPLKTNFHHSGKLVTPLRFSFLQCMSSFCVLYIFVLYWTLNTYRRRKRNRILNL